jgi:Fe-S oxidoreductase
MSRSRASPQPSAIERHTESERDPSANAYLARYSGVIEPPRRVLGKVAEVREFSWSGTDTDCCGGAGLLPKTMPAIANRMARDRLKSVGSQGGGTVVTSCGTCAFMLKSNAPSNVEVKDLATAVADAIGLQASDRGEAL